MQYERKKSENIYTTNKKRQNIYRSVRKIISKCGKWDSNCEMGFCDVPNFEAESLENSGFEKNVKMF